MNKLFLFLFLGLLAAGCSKSSTTPNKTNSSATGGLSGTYVDYKSIDTVYNNQLVADGIESITLQSTYGDTTVFYPGTVNVKTYYNNIGGYDPKSVTEDTLRFNSNNTAVETNANTDIPAIKLTYDLKSGTFNDGAVTGSSSTVIERFVKVNSTTIELITNEKDGDLTGNVVAIYYRKQ